ncbi:hypothetical protein ACO0LC_22225 [Undibacterium sp. JH2W]|uniref:hypothetical protein n=1 Tax=Undibacterium sp. JH2W TaxID=3413037 RepID=UPI003BF091F2
MSKICRLYVFAILLFVTAISPVHSHNLNLDLTPDQAEKWAGIAATVLHTTTGKNLDYSPESLQIVDEYVLNLKKNGANPQGINKTLIALGCYVGQVMVQNLGSRWDNPTPTEMKLGFDATGIRAKNGAFSQPIGKVFKLLRNGEEDSVVAFYISAKYLVQKMGTNN